MCDKKTINEQLNIPTRKVGQVLYAPSLYGGEGEYRAGSAPMVAGQVYRNADGSWDNATGDCLGITASTPPKGVIACVKGRAIYPIPAVWALLKTTKKGREKIEFNRCVCAARFVAKKADDVVPTGGVVDDRSLDTGSGSTNQTNSTDSNSSTGMSTGVKIGIGIGVLAIIGVTIYLIRRKK